MDTDTITETETVAKVAGPAFSVELARALGMRMGAYLTQKHGGAFADEFATSCTVPTMPGTPERTIQDKNWAKLTARLDSVTKDEAK